MITQSKAINDLGQELKETRLKYAYFLLAAAGAALGFGVQKLDGLATGQSIILPVLSLASWLASFLFGCWNVAKAQDLLVINMDLINAIQRGDIGQVAEDHMDDYTKNAKKGRWYRSLQFLLLVLGVVFFATWRILLLLHPPYDSHCIP